VEVPYSELRQKGRFTDADPAWRRDGMSWKERVTVALLLTAAVAGYALIPRVLPAPEGDPGNALGTGLGGTGTSVVAVPGVPRGATVPSAQQLPARSGRPRAV